MSKDKKKDDDEQTALDWMLFGEAGKESKYSFSKLIGYIVYYTSLVIMFCFTTLSNTFRKGDDHEDK
jgi:hypothetical protein